MHTNTTLPMFQIILKKNLELQYHRVHSLRRKPVHGWQIHDLCEGNHCAMMQKSIFAMVHAFNHLPAHVFRCGNVAHSLPTQPHKNRSVTMPCQTLYKPTIFFSRRIPLTTISRKPPPPCTRCTNHKLQCKRISSWRV